MKIKNFEEIEAWKEAKKLTFLIYKLTNNQSFSRDYGLKDQIQRAAVSCMSNIAEGFESDTNQQFIQFLIYTRRSSAEVKSILYVAAELRYINMQEFEGAYKQAEQVAKLTNGFISYLKHAKR